MEICVELDFRWNYRNRILSLIHSTCNLEYLQSITPLKMTSFFSVIPAMNNTITKSKNVEELLHHVFSNNPHVPPRGYHLGY